MSIFISSDRATLTYQHHEYPLDRLPKWGQQLVRDLARELSATQRELADEREGPEDSDTFVIRGLDLVPLGQRTGIRFGGRGFNQTLDVMLTTSGELQICSGRGIAIRPVASNMVRIAFTE